MIELFVTSTLTLSATRSWTMPLSMPTTVPTSPPEVTTLSPLLSESSIFWTCFCLLRAGRIRRK